MTLQFNYDYPVLDAGYVALLDMMPHPDTDVSGDLAIVNAARVSFLGESKGAERDKKLLFYLMKHHHTTPFEMVEFKLRIKAPLFVARQWMRHRTWSYNEVSRRYTDEGIQFYVPDVWRLQASNNKQGSAGWLLDGLLSSNEYVDAIDKARETYENLIMRGVAREQARAVLPQSMYTTFIAKVDAHNLMHFLRLRMHPHAQYEIREYATAIYDNIFKPTLPWTAEAFEKYQLGDT